MKINQILIFITTAVVLYSISSSGPVDAWLFRWDTPTLSARTTQGCDKNEKCEKSEKCINSVCKNACLDQKCNDKLEGCLVIDHVARCVSKEKACKNKNECHSSELCRNLYCISACGEKDCPDTQVCQVKNHEASCLAIPDESCTKHADCDPDEICKKNKCMHACDDKKCGRYQKCEVSGHEASCKCAPGYEMNSSTKECDLRKCTSDDQCKGRQICKPGSGDRYCECLDGHNRDDKGYCVKSCTKSSECGHLEVCNSIDSTCSCVGTASSTLSGSPFSWEKLKWNDSTKKCDDKP